MLRSGVLREQFLDFKYICCAIFHGENVQGGSLPFFQNNFIMKTERNCLFTPLHIRT
ncbi:RAxF-45 family protein [Bacillus sp. JJ722]|uniref:RAxF-45 family protein n=1 Tax=Bacillus sp. JJ722 TaxID=3122973 RepID=UPI002FFF3483